LCSVASLADDVFGELGLVIDDLRAAKKLHLLVEWSAIKARFAEAAEEAEALRKEQLAAELEAEAQRKAIADTEAQRKADADREAQRKAIADAEAQRKADADREAQRKADADAEAQRKAIAEEKETEAEPPQPPVPSEVEDGVVMYFMKHVEELKLVFTGVSKNGEGRFAAIGRLYDALVLHGPPHG
jgi:flagellar biosynthesis GTPase FlhF